MSRKGVGTRASAKKERQGARDNTQAKRVVPPKLRKKPPPVTPVPKWPLASDTTKVQMLSPMQPAEEIKWLMLAIDGWIADNESRRLKLTDIEQSFVARYNGIFRVTGLMAHLDDLRQFVIDTTMRGIQVNENGDVIFLYDQLQTVSAVMTPTSSVHETLDTLDTPREYQTRTMN